MATEVERVKQDFEPRIQSHQKTITTLNQRMSRIKGGEAETYRGETAHIQRQIQAKQGSISNLQRRYDARLHLAESHARGEWGVGEHTIAKREAEAKATVVKAKQPEYFVQPDTGKMTFRVGGEVPKGKGWVSMGAEKPTAYAVRQARGISQIPHKIVEVREPTLGVEPTVRVKPRAEVPTLTEAIIARQPPPPTFLGGMSLALAKGREVVAKAKEKYTAYTPPGLVPVSKAAIDFSKYLSRTLKFEKAKEVGIKAKEKVVSIKEIKHPLVYDVKQFVGVIPKGLKLVKEEFGPEIKTEAQKLKGIREWKKDMEKIEDVFLKAREGYVWAEAKAKEWKPEPIVKQPAFLKGIDPYKGFREQTKRQVVGAAQIGKVTMGAMVGITEEVKVKPYKLPLIYGAGVVAGPVAAKVLGVGKVAKVAGFGIGTAWAAGIGVEAAITPPGLEREKVVGVRAAEIAAFVGGAKYGIEKKPLAELYKARIREPRFERSIAKWQKGITAKWKYVDRGPKPPKKFLTPEEYASHLMKEKRLGKIIYHGTKQWEQAGLPSRGAGRLTRVYKSKFIMMDVKPPKIDIRLGSVEYPPSYILRHELLHLKYPTFKEKDILALTKVIKKFPVKPSKVPKIPTQRTLYGEPISPTKIKWLRAEVRPGFYGMDIARYKAEGFETKFFQKHLKDIYTMKAIDWRYPKVVTITPEKMTTFKYRQILGAQPEMFTFKKPPIIHRADITKFDTSIQTMLAPKIMKVTKYDRPFYLTKPKLPKPVILGKPKKVTPVHVKPEPKPVKVKPTEVMPGVSVRPVYAVPPKPTPPADVAVVLGTIPRGTALAGAIALGGMRFGVKDLSGALQSQFGAARQRAEQRQATKLGQELEEATKQAAEQAARQVAKTKPVVKVIPKVTPIVKVTPILKIPTKQIPVVRQVTPTIPYFYFDTYIPPPPPPPTPTTPPPPILKFKWPRGIFYPKVKRKKKIKPFHKYQPSLVAVSKKITTKEMKMPKYLTGVGIRPIRLKF